MSESVTERDNAPLRVLHVLANSRPDLNGYAIRSHDLITAQSNHKSVEPHVITSPWYPERRSMSEEINIDGIEYLRCVHPAYHNSNKGLGLRWVSWRGKKKIPPEKSETSVGGASEKKANLALRAAVFASTPLRRILRMGNSWIEEKILFKFFRKKLRETVLEIKPDIIHAHTPYRVGMPAMLVAKELGIPFVYEMRGIWEDTAVANGRWKNKGFAYNRFRRMENKVLTNANRVFCISETLRTEAISRGVNSELITVVNNAVGNSISRDFNGREINGFDETLKRLNKSEESVVVGYIGSIQPLEGLDLLAESVAVLKKRGKDVRFLVISGSKGKKEFVKKCEALGIADISEITGPFPPIDIGAFYQLIDIFGVCRPPGFRVTELVTPVKPFESMYSGTATVVSDLPALKEIVKHEETGMNFIAGDVNSLADNIERLIDDVELRNRLSTNAMKWIEEERMWSKIVNLSVNGYQELLEN
jgi:glycosyltransferase involved in cell wall biosynthesis